MADQFSMAMKHDFGFLPIQDRSVEQNKDTQVGLVYLQFDRPDEVVLGLLQLPCEVMSLGQMQVEQPGLVLLAQEVTSPL